MILPAEHVGDLVGQDFLLPQRRRVVLDDNKSTEARALQSLFSALRPGRSGEAQLTGGAVTTMAA